MDEIARMLEERAERGTPRGIDAIVGAAERRAENELPPESDTRSPRRLAVVSVAATVILLAAALLWLTRDSSPDPGRVATTPTTSTAPTVLSAEWVATSPAGIAGRFAAATATDGHRMFVFGGLSGSRSTSFTDGALFDPATNTWDRVPDAPDGFGGPDAVAVWDGSRFLVLAPADVDHPVRLAAYEPDAHTWHELAAPPIGARDGYVAVWTGTRLVVGGGGSGDQIPALFGASYAPATNAWEVLPAPPYTHYVPAGAVWDGSAVIFIGGVEDNDGTSVGPQKAVPGAVYTPGSPGTWASTLPPGPVSRPQWASVTPSGISVVGTNDRSQIEVATLDRPNNGWIGFRTFDAPGAVWRAVPAGATGWAAVSTSGGIVFERDKVRTLPAADFADRSGASIVTVGSHLVMWGGLHDTGDQDRALDTGMFIPLEDVVAPTTTTSPPEPGPQPPPDEIALDLDADGRYDDLRATADGQRATLTLTLASGEISHLDFNRCAIGTPLLTGVGLLNGQPLIFYNECGNTVMNAQLATVIDGSLARVTFDDGGDIITWTAHSNCCPMATVDAACTSSTGSDTLVRTSSRLVHHDGTEVKGYDDVDFTQSPAQLAAQLERSWVRSRFRLDGQHLELLGTDSGTVALDAPDPDGVPLRNRLHCGTAVEPQ